MVNSPYQIFNNWLFDGSRSTPVPPAKNGVDILKYNSPITHTFALQMFMRHGPLNHYLNKYFNNINLRYLEKEDLFLFLKKCVLDFRVMKRDTVFYPYKPKNKLFDKLRVKIPELKNNDVELLTEIIEKSKDRDLIYDTLGLKKPPKKKKVKIGKKKIDKKGKISLNDFMEKHFSIMEK
jgi:hypothetical protein